MAKIMKTAAWVSLLLTALWAALYLNMGLDLFLALAITFGTTAYHFAMRLAVGGVINSLLHNRVDYRARWFQVSPREQKLYKALRVKAWKGKMPTYDPCSFDREKHSWEEIAQAMCQAELVHEAIIPLSFLPLLAAVPFVWFVITKQPVAIHGYFQYRNIALSYWAVGVFLYFLFAKKEEQS